MKTHDGIWHKLLRGLPSAAAGLMLVFGNQVVAETVSATDYAAYPPLVKSDASPRVMLAMSRDEQLYHKAYSDYSDLDGDGVIDTTYKDSITYYGYFNSDFCYSYNDGQFNPNNPVAGDTHQCSGNWSGNFLNWATMTRMDVLRRVMYGGKRSVDTASSTVLQRAMIPKDAHAFVKVYTGNDIAKYTPYSGIISLCNVTDGIGLSRNLDVTGYPPLLKVVSGAWPQWSSAEAPECQYKGSSSDSPDTTYRLAERNVRVASCVTGQDDSADYCRAYTNSSSGTVTKKPAGILQERGEDGGIYFGLMTGSFNKKDRGGVLRKNAVPLAGNSNDSDNEVNLSNGTFTGHDGIISTLNTLRIAGYSFDGKGKYSDCDHYGISVAEFKASTDGPTSGEQCRDWGNPMAEIYLETLRYLAGLTATAGFDTDDSTWLPGLKTTSWQDPLDQTEPCASCAIIVISTGLNTFDGDNLDNTSGLPAATKPDGTSSNSPDAWTALVGSLEGITGHKYIVSNVGSGTGSVNANLCSTKTITNLADVDGICPDLPQMEGTYKLDGLAYYAHLADLRDNTDFPGTQKVDTYSLALAENLPSFEFKAASGKSVSLVPSCQAKQSYGWSDCSLVDVTVEKQTTNYSQMLISWEDSHWGNDYDMDGISTLEVCSAIGDRATVVAKCPLYGTSNTTSFSGQDFQANFNTDTVQVRVSIVSTSASLALRFGYVMNGSASQDGLYIGAVRANANTSVVSRLEAPMVYTAASATGALLKNPLWYAAKYGNFNDIDHDNTPASQSGDTREWDSNSISGAAGADGLPDNFFPVSNPTRLVSVLKSILDNISTRVTSGTAVAVTLERSDGVGATFQAYYYPRFDQTSSQTSSRSVRWVGGLHALFLDPEGRLREDSNHDQTLTDADYEIRLVYGGGSNSNSSGRPHTRVERYSVTTGAQVDTIELPQLNTLWDARDTLADLSTSQVANQRHPYNNASSDNRYIFTWIDRNKDGKVDETSDPTSNEILDFKSTTFASDHRYRYLGVSDAAMGSKIVKWIRGEELPGFRSRTIDFGSGTKVWRLGDILSSSPVVVATPGANYDTLYRDSTYEAFRTHYFHRRQVVYVGANDGMLHAFNAGFYNAESKKFTRTYNTSSPEAAHALGSELWAYVPYNLLPHLRWLTQPSYPHVFYVDGPPKAYDVNMFPDDSTHIHGWGTILVVPFGFGGGDISVDTTGDSVDDTTMRSAILVLDITDPEQPPKLIAEITDPELGFTTSAPTLVKARAVDSTSGLYAINDDAWYLVFGSGPAGSNAATKHEALTSGVSNQTAKVFVYDLVNKKLLDFDNTTPGIQPLDSGVADSFAGNMRSVDWNSDYFDDDVYFGITSGTPASPGGRVERLRFNLNPSQAQPFQYNSLGYLIDLSEPVQGAPNTFVNQVTQDHWVLFGTGRFYTSHDNQPNYPGHVYGVLENSTSTATTTTAALANTTGLLIGTDNTAYDSAGNTPVVVKGTSVGDFDTLKTTVHNAGGWVTDIPPAQMNNRQGRVYTGLVSVGLGIAYVEYHPSGNICAPEGVSALVVVDPRTGTASRDISFGIYDGEGNVVDGGGNTLYSQAGNNIANTYVLRQPEETGASASPTPIVGRDGTTRLATQQSTAAINFSEVQSTPLQSGRQSWRELPLREGD